MCQLEYRQVESEIKTALGIGLLVLIQLIYAKASLGIMILQNFGTYHLGGVGAPGHWAG